MSLGLRHVFVPLMRHDEQPQHCTYEDPSWSRLVLAVVQSNIFRLPRRD